MGLRLYPPQTKLRKLGRGGGISLSAPLVPVVPSGDAVLLETGDNLLLETGDDLLLE